MKEKEIPVERITGQLSNMVRRLINKTFADFPYSGAENGCISFIVEQTEKKHGEGIFQRDLEKEFNLRSPTASEIIKKLEEKGLIVRENIEADGRKKKIIPTQKALECDAASRKKLREMEKQIVKGISKEEIDSFRAVSKKLMENLYEAVEK